MRPPTLEQQSIGPAEATVKVAKQPMKMYSTAKEDPYLGLLNLRNTLQEGPEMSPAQQLFERRTKTMIPTTQQMLRPTVVM